MAKPFSWSFSKLKNYENCPLRMSEVDLKKGYQDDSEALRYGNDAHDALAKACMGERALPTDMDDYQIWVDRVRAGPGALHVEQQLAITKSFQKTGWFTPNAWYRAKVDVARINAPVALALDWKTGKRKPDSVQLMLAAQCIFSHWPAVTHVRSEFVWLQEAETDSETYTRETLAALWPDVLARVALLQQSVAGSFFPPKPSPLCGWCPVATCAHYKGYKPGSR